jgi:hAT family C-terminal dimerisation region
MLPRLVRAEEKLKKYTKKLSKSPYYLAARILNPERRTAFLRDGNDNSKMTETGEKQLYIVRKLWERFRDKVSSPEPAPSYDAQRCRPEVNEEELSTFQKAIRKRGLQATRPQNEDEFESYINENPVMLESRTRAIDWWSQSAQRLRFPQLSLLAIEVLSIPGMSDKPERVFSGSRRRIPWDRTMTSTKILEQTECAKDWADQGILSISL